VNESRRLIRVMLVAVLAASFSFFSLAGAQAARYKTPDQTPNDHPSGKDRSVEPGGSGTQGKAVSDPDANTNGGADKPGLTGGYDTDRDGNNGCGNDDDFEDDNNGWCGHHPKPTHAVVAAAAAVAGVSQVKTPTGSGVTPAGSAPQVLGEVFVRSAAAPAAPAGSAVLGETVTRGAVSGGSLARTGGAFGGMLALALGMLLVGAVLVRASRPPAFGRAHRSIQR
jgi:hypothetical protein